MATGGIKEPKSGRASFALIACISIGLLLFALRLIFESAIPSPSFWMLSDDLARYRDREAPGLSIKDYASRLYKLGLQGVFVTPSTLQDLILTGDAKVRSWSDGRAVIEVSGKIRPLDSFSNSRNRDGSIAVNSPSADLADLPMGFVLPFDSDFTGYIPENDPIDLLFFSLKNPGFWMSPRPDNLPPVIMLPSGYERKHRDGSIAFGSAATAMVRYDDESAENGPLNLFQPDEKIDSISTVLHQYRRAFLERKIQYFIIPFFENQKISPQVFLGPIPGLEPILDRQKVRTLMGSAFKAPWMFFWLVVLKYLFLSLFIYLALFLLGIRPRFAGIIGIPSLLLIFFPWIASLYIMVFVTLFSRKIFQLALAEGSAPKILAKALGWIFPGILAISAMGTNSGYLAKSMTIHGVTLAVLLAFAGVLWTAFKESRLPAGGFFSNRWAIPALAVCGGGVLALLFTGRSLFPAAILPMEGPVRDFLDTVLFSRPRFKEMLFGYPLLVFCLLAFKKGLIGPGARNILLVLSSVGWISSFNTFCHFQSFAGVCLIRTVSGIAIGSLLGWLAFIIYSSAGTNLNKRKDAV